MTQLLSRFMRRVPTAVAVLALFAIGCAPSEDAIAEAVIEALATTAVPATTSTTASVAAATEAECDDLRSQHLRLASAWYGALGAVPRTYGNVSPAESRRRWKPHVWAVYDAGTSLLPHASRMVVRCANVGDAEEQRDLRELGDALESLASELVEWVRYCHEDFGAFADECPPAPMGLGSRSHPTVPLAWR